MVILLAIIYSVFEAFNLKAYLYQYTIHKFVTLHGIGPDKEDKFYPPKYRYYMLMGKINWIVIAILAFYSWQTALILFGIGWVLGIILPSNHTEDLKMLRDYLWNDRNLRYDCMVEILIIDRILDETDVK